MKIVLLETLQIGSDINYDCLNGFGEVIAYEQTNTYEEMRERIADADIIIVDQFPINEQSIGKANKLKLVTMTSTGTNFVDFDYTNKAGIAVANIRGYSTNSVAQHTFALLLYLYEKIAYFDYYVKKEEYVNDTFNSSFSVKFHELCGKTWGIVGMGQIGVQVAKIASAFGCKVIYNSPSGNPHNTDYPHVQFEELLSESDIISVHTPLTEKTAEIFGYEEYKKMKRSAYFINVARGGVISEKGLAKALEENLIAGAGLDVLTAEPMSPECALRPFKDSSKLVITPHMAWASVESRTRAMEEVYLNIRSYLNGEKRNLCR
ncbi:NAD(P)-dependent oxidoreductase [Aminipila sp.]|uniref:NAD(P)-dependent oxidoreductase n=1 Tax=Aminipila sp. TaxID=2060095 RepID=UPI0028966C32|nr:NAD(P)-dependent oxidoreductase [Aminipila sp.]